MASECLGRSWYVLCVRRLGLEGTRCFPLHDWIACGPSILCMPARLAAPATVEPSLRQVLKKMWICSSLGFWYFLGRFLVLGLTAFLLSMVKSGKENKGYQHTSSKRSNLLKSYYPKCFMRGEKCWTSSKVARRPVTYLPLSTRHSTFQKPWSIYYVPPHKLRSCQNVSTISDMDSNIGPEWNYQPNHCSRQIKQP